MPDTRSQQVLKTFTGLSSATVALTLDEVDITDAVTEGLTGSTGVGADQNRGAVCTIDFVLTSDAAITGRGFFVDDVEIVLSP